MAHKVWFSPVLFRKSLVILYCTLPRDYISFNGLLVSHSNNIGCDTLVPFSEPLLFGERWSFRAMMQNESKIDVMPSLCDTISKMYYVILVMVSRIGRLSARSTVQSLFFEYRCCRHKTGKWLLLCNSL